MNFREEEWVDLTTSSLSVVAKRGRKFELAAPECHNGPRAAFDSELPSGWRFQQPWQPRPSPPYLSDRDISSPHLPSLTAQHRLPLCSPVCLCLRPSDASFVRYTWLGELNWNC